MANRVLGHARARAFWLIAPLAVASATILWHASVAQRSGERNTRGELARPDDRTNASGTPEPGTPQAGAVSLRVLDGHTRRPIAGAVVVRLPELMDILEELPRGTTNELGRHDFDGTGIESVFVYAAGYRTERFDLPKMPDEILMQPAPPVELEVVDREGQPVPHAVAALENAPAIQFHADDFGRIRARTRERLRVSARGFARRLVAAIDARVVLAPGFSCGGRIVDGAGKPVENARVYVQQVSPRTGRARILTDTAGSFRCDDLAMGEVYLRVRKKGHIDQWADVWTGDTDVEIAAPRAGSIDVLVLTPKGTPAPDADVHITGPGVSDLHSDLPPGRYLVRAHAPPLAARATVSLAEGEHKTVRLTLSDADEDRGPGYRLRIVDPNGEPVPGAIVDGKPTGADGIVTSHWPTSPRLRVVVEPPPALRSKLAPQLVSVRLVAQPLDAEQVVKLVAPAVFELEVVDLAGNPVQLATETNNRSYAIKDGEHRWLVAPSTTTRVTLLHDDRWPRFFEGLPGRHRVVVHKPRAITGRVRDEHGGVAAAWVWWWEGEGECRAADDGRFRVVRHPSRADDAIYVGRGLIPEAVLHVNAPRDADVDVGEVIVRAPRRVSGRVLDDQGKPLGGARIREVPRFSRRDFEEIITTRSDGTFTMLVPAMLADCLILKDGYGARFVRVEDLHEVVLPAPGTLEMDTREHGLRIQWTRDDGTTAWSDWSESLPEQLAPGDYIVQTHVDEGVNRGVTQRHEVTITEGQTTRVWAE